jgi:hypothetical protein
MSSRSAAPWKAIGVDFMNGGAAIAKWLLGSLARRVGAMPAMSHRVRVGHVLDRVAPVVQ